MEEYQISVLRVTDSDYSRYLSQCFTDGSFNDIKLYRVGDVLDYIGNDEFMKDCDQYNINTDRLDEFISELKELDWSEVLITIE